MSHEGDNSRSDAGGGHGTAEKAVPEEQSERRDLALPPAGRVMRAVSMAVFFALGALVTWLIVANPLGVPWLPASSSRAPDSASGVVSTEDVWTCPMHPQVVDGQPGDCPICGMDLVRQEPRDVATEVYRCPMHPEVVEHQPGSCPICGMDLVAVAAMEGDDEPTPRRAAGHAALRIDPAQVQNIGVVSVPAEIRTVARSSRTVGILDFNADRITWVNTKFDGWIEKVHVSYVGQEVTAGQPLFEIYSPELVTTQEEYVRALEYRESLRLSGRAETRRQAESLVQSTRDRLLYWDVNQEQIDRLERTRKVQRRLTVTSPADGVVAEVKSDALEGMHVGRGVDLYKVADLSTVWVHADIYESDIPWIRAGQPAVVSFRNSPGMQFRGKVLFLYPEVSRDTRTLKICVEVPNPGRRLRPGMYADVGVQGPPVRDATVVPLSAVIRSGERNIVFVDLGQGRFEPREVELGVKGEGDRIQLVRGVAAGEKVVTQAQFMLDSESRMQEAISQFRQRSTVPGGEP